MRGKQILSVILAAIMVMCLGACKKEEEKEEDFDAAGYVTASLDAMYKGEYKKYAEFTGEEEASIQESQQKDFANQIGETFSGMDITEEERDSYYAFAQKLYALSNYTVGKAKKEEDGNYTVLVKVQPCDFWLTYYAGIEERLTTFASEKDSFTDSGLFAEELAYMNECLGSIAYQEEAEITVTVTKNKDAKYTISKEDMETLQNIMFPVE